MKTVEELEAEIKRLDELIAPLSDKRAECKQAILNMKSPFKAGDIIEWNGGRRGRVEQVIPWVCGYPMWSVTRIRKDGSDGEKVQVREYHKPRLANVPAEQPRPEGAQPKGK